MLDVLTSIDSKCLISNVTDNPSELKKHQHICQVNAVYVLTVELAIVFPLAPPSVAGSETKIQGLILAFPATKAVWLRPKPLSVWVLCFLPQRKGCLPQNVQKYSVELQEKFDSLEGLTVLFFWRMLRLRACMSINAPFSLNKPSGGTQLVNTFSDVGQFSIPTTSHVGLHFLYTEPTAGSL